jgi:UDP-N-acetylglucosamine 1-carboxyvinyltransferase
VGTDRIEIEGVPELHGAVHRVVPDRIEAGTLLVAAAITQGDVRVTDMVPAHVAAVLAKLEECGVAVEVGPTWVRVRAQGRARPTDIVTSPFPGFPTDMQAQIMALCAVADGTSVVTDTIYLDRFTHVPELARLGAQIELKGNAAVIRGIERLQGAPVMATDIRASAALVIAALVAEGETKISRIYHLDRGYEDIVGKLSKLGARAERVREKVA